MSIIQWVFSGIGVLIVGAVGTWIYRHFSNRRQQTEPAPSQRISDSTIVGPVAGRDINIENFHAGKVEAMEADDEYRTTPTQADIMRSISNASIYAKPTIAANYEGLKIRWSGSLYNIHEAPDGYIDVMVGLDDLVAPPVVVAPVKLSEYPILKSVRGGEPVTVMGIIHYVQTNGMVHLREAKLRFH